MFSMASFSSISFATVTPSLVINGEPNFLSRTTLRPLGPNVIFTASASTLTPRKIACRDASPVTICFAISQSPLSSFGFSIVIRGDPLGGRVRELLFAAGRFRCAAEFGEYFVFLENHVFLVVDLYIVSTVFSEQDA